MSPSTKHRHGFVIILSSEPMMITESIAYPIKMGVDLLH